MMAAQLFLTMLTLRKPFPTETRMVLLLEEGPCGGVAGLWVIRANSLGEEESGPGVENHRLSMSSLTYLADICQVHLSCTFPGVGLNRAL